MLSGKRIIVAQWNCSVEAPGDDWLWYHIAGAPSDTRPRGYSEPYYAINPGKAPTYGFYVAAHTNGETPDKAYMSALESELRHITESLGAKFSDWRYEPSTIPLAGSRRFTYTVKRQDGTTWYDFGYVGGTDRKFIFTVESPSPEEPGQFAAFVGSLRLEDTKQVRPDA